MQSEPFTLSLSKGEEAFRASTSSARTVLHESWFKTRLPRRPCGPPRNDEGRQSAGVALITVIIILMFLGALGTALIAVVYSRLSAVTLEVDRLQAQYLAEAGIAQGLHEIKTGLDVFGGGRGNIPVTALGPGFYRVDIDPDTSTLTAIGVVRDVRRVVVTKYE